MMLRTFIYFILVVSGFCINGLAAEKVKFGTFPIPLMVEDKDNGVFIELTKTIAQRAKLDFEISIYPPKRTINHFLNKSVDILFPALDVNFPPGAKFVKTKELIYLKEDFVFTKKGKPFYKALSDLENKKVGITLGYPYARVLTTDKAILLETSNTDETNIKKLMVGRISAFVVEEKSGIKAFEKMGYQLQMQYAPNTPISKQEVYYAFQATPQGEKLARIVSDVLGEMKKDGTFAQIMKKATPK